MRINCTQNSPNSRQNFGWNIKTHSMLTKAALEHVPELTPYSKFLSLGSQLADIRAKYTGMIGNSSHEYFGRGALEYDLNPENAFDMFHVNLTDLGLWLREGSRKLSMYKAGIALHFLQDMSVPIHVKEECFGIMKMVKHILYEAKAKHQQDYIKGLVPNRKEPVNFYDNFIATYKKSSQMQNPFEIKDKQLTEASVKESLHTAYDATYNFLQRLNETFHSKDKGQLIFKDFNDSEFIKSLLKVQI